MKNIAIASVLFIIILTSCNQQSSRADGALRARVDSLQKELADVYKPGLGEFMYGIQVHHAKLWFAGKNENWKLADFEINEIKEALDDIKKYCTDRPEIKEIGMLDPAVDSLNNAITNKNSPQFEKAFLLMTNTCNNCHKATAHEFNVIKVPDTVPLSNQDFKLK